MTATTEAKLNSLREAIRTLRLLDELTKADAYLTDIQVLEEIAAEIAEQEDDLGPSRIREILEAVEAGMPS